MVEVKKYAELSSEDRKRLRLLLEKMYLELGRDPSLAREYASERELSGGHKEYVLWYDEKGRLSGLLTLSYSPGRKEAEVEEVYVEKGQRGKGIARLLLNRAYNRAAEKGVKKLNAVVVSKEGLKAFEASYGKTHAEGYVKSWEARVEKKPRVPAHGFLSKEGLDILKKARGRKRGK